MFNMCCYTWDLHYIYTLYTHCIYVYTYTLQKRKYLPGVCVNMHMYICRGKTRGGAPDGKHQNQ
jgi:hypothetical protein